MFEIHSKANPKRGYGVVRGILTWLNSYPNCVWQNNVPRKLTVSFIIDYTPLYNLLYNKAQLYNFLYMQYGTLCLFVSSSEVAVKKWFYNEITFYPLKITIILEKILPWNDNLFLCWQNMDILLDTGNAQPHYVSYHIPVRTCHIIILSVRVIYIFTRRLFKLNINFNFLKVLDCMTSLIGFTDHQQ